MHGGFVDGSGWEGVYRILKKDGYRVSIVQNPTTSLADDVAATKRVIAEQKGPVILVGHSYGGAVITEAGNDPRVAGLVYITAFAPDRGESVANLIKDPPPGAPVPPILPPQEGFLVLDKAKFAASFAADVAPEKAEFMANSQVPWGVVALNGAITQPAWESKPSWYLVATDDRMIPPARSAGHGEASGMPASSKRRAATRSTSRSRRQSPTSSRRRRRVLRRGRFCGASAGRSLHALPALFGSTPAAHHRGPISSKSATYRVFISRGRSPPPWS